MLESMSPRARKSLDARSLPELSLRLLSVWHYRSVILRQLCSDRITKTLVILTEQSVFSVYITVAFTCFKHFYRYSAGRFFFQLFVLCTCAGTWYNFLVLLLHGGTVFSSPYLFQKKIREQQSSKFISPAEYHPAVLHLPLGGGCCASTIIIYTVYCIWWVSYTALP